MNSLGRQIRQLREAAGLTQAELAERTGTSQSAVAHLESGRRIPTLTTLQKFAHALGRDVVVTLSCRDGSETCSLA
ncbi:helix-turn-helix transcriptional regulator [Geodermatophilus sp. SYSU D01106]